MPLQIAHTVIVAAGGGSIFQGVVNRLARKDAQERAGGDREDAAAHAGALRWGDRTVVVRREGTELIGSG